VGAVFLANIAAWAGDDTALHVVLRCFKSRNVIDMIVAGNNPALTL
jgi:hypothetical protein